MSDKRARILFCSLIALGIGIGAAGAFWTGCRLRAATIEFDRRIDEIARALSDRRKIIEGTTPRPLTAKP